MVYPEDRQLFKNNRGDCPNCKHKCGFLPMTVRTVWPKWDADWLSPGPGGTKTPFFPRALVAMRVFECQSCNRTSVIFDRVRNAAGVMERPQFELVSEEIVWPRMGSRRLNEAAPELARGLFTEASLCEISGALRGAAALYRATVEALCDDLDVPKKRLYDRLEDLKKRPEIPDELVDDLHEARIMGNDSLHDGVLFSTDEVQDVAELIGEAVTLIYVQPAQRKAMREARRDRQRAHKAATSTETTAETATDSSGA
jgi:Domain of unknown function (DUF4145)